MIKRGRYSYPLRQRGLFFLYCRRIMSLFCPLNLCNFPNETGKGYLISFFYVPNRKVVNSISVQSTDSIRLRILEQKEVHIMFLGQFCNSGHSEKWRKNNTVQTFQSRHSKNVLAKWPGERNGSTIDKVLKRCQLYLGSIHIWRQMFLGYFWLTY